MATEDLSLRAKTKPYRLCSSDEDPHSRSSGQQRRSPRCKRRNYSRETFQLIISEQKKKKAERPFACSLEVERFEERTHTGCRRHSEEDKGHACDHERRPPLDAHPVVFAAKQLSRVCASRWDSEEG